MDLTRVTSLVDAIGRIGQAKSVSEVVDLFCDALAPCGFTAALVSGLPNVEPAQWPHHIVANRWPKAWFAHYNENRLYSSDPCVDFARRYDEPFFWTDVSAQDLERAQRQVMDAATEFRLKQGVCVPLTRPFAAPAVITVSGEFVDLPADTLGIVQLLAIHAFSQLKALGEGHGSAEGQRLSPREREILTWVAAGKTVWEISCILSLSHHTVGSHLRNARTKLDAVNVTHCVVEALRREEIRL